MSKPAAATLPTLEQAWLSWRNTVMSGASDSQLIESKRAFFAGVLSLMTLTKRIGEPDISEDEGVFILERIDREITVFFAKVQSGHA